MFSAEVMNPDSLNGADKGSAFSSPQVSMYTTQMLYLVSLSPLELVRQHRMVGGGATGV